MDSESKLLPNWTVLWNDFNTEFDVAYVTVFRTRSAATRFYNSLPGTGITQRYMRPFESGDEECLQDNHPELYDILHKQIKEQPQESNPPSRDWLDDAAGSLHSLVCRDCGYTFVGAKCRLVCNSCAEPNLLVGQRVFLTRVGGIKEIGTIVSSENQVSSGHPKESVWVFSPTKGHASAYAVHNVKPLPNGQL